MFAAALWQPLMSWPLLKWLFYSIFSHESSIPFDLLKKVEYLQSFAIKRIRLSPDCIQTRLSYPGFDTGARYSPEGWVGMQSNTGDDYVCNFLWGCSWSDRVHASRHNRKWSDSAGLRPVSRSPQAKRWKERQLTLWSAINHQCHSVTCPYRSFRSYTHADQGQFQRTHHLYPGHNGCLWISAAGLGSHSGIRFWLPEL